MNIVLAMTGASGAIYGARLLDVLIAAGKKVHLVISPAAVEVCHHELGLNINLDEFELGQLLPPEGATWLESSASGRSSIFAESDIITSDVVYHHYRDWQAGIASGSFRTEGMVICPCSMGTLGAIAGGLSENLIHRAAHVHLKEHRKLILVPRETPLGSIQLDAMKTLTDAGAVMLPAMPGFYHNPVSIHDLVDFIVGRICDQLDIDRDLITRWGNDH